MAKNRLVAGSVDYDIHRWFNIFDVRFDYFSMLFDTPWKPRDIYFGSDINMQKRFYEKRNKTDRLRVATIHLVFFFVKTNSDDWTSTAVTLHGFEFTASASDDSTLQISDRDMRRVIKQFDTRYFIWHTRHMYLHAAVCLRQVRVARPP